MSASKKCCTWNFTCDDELVIVSYYNVKSIKYSPLGEEYKGEVKWPNIEMIFH